MGEATHDEHRAKLDATFEKIRAEIEKRERDLTDSRKEALDRRRATDAAQREKLESVARQEWLAGRRHLAVWLPAGATERQAAVWGEEYSTEDTIAWGRILDAITAVGWKLHTWTASKSETESVTPTLLFVRPD